MVISPETLFKMIFVNPAVTDGAISTSVNYGILLSAVGIATFTARNSVPSTARRGYLIQIAIAGLLISAYDCYNIISGMDTKQAWGVVVLTAIIGIWGLALLLKEKTA